VQWRQTEQYSSYGELLQSATILSVKQELASKTDMPVGSQSLYLIEDSRQEGDLELKNSETVRQAVEYSAASMTELQFAVMLGLQGGNAADLMKALPPSAPPVLKLDLIEDSQHDSRLFGVAFVPAHPELVVVAAWRWHRIAVYHRQTKALLAAMPKALSRLYQLPGHLAGPKGYLELGKGGSTIHGGFVSRPIRSISWCLNTTTTARRCCSCWSETMEASTSSSSGL
jgi:hypothetical protein